MYTLKSYVSMYINLLLSPEQVHQTFMCSSFNTLYKALQIYDENNCEHVHVEIGNEYSWNFCQ